jgi:hypothetical protein
MNPNLNPSASESVSVSGCAIANGFQKAEADPEAATDFTGANR